MISLYTNADNLINNVENLKLLNDSLDVKLNILAITKVESKHIKIQSKISELKLLGYIIISNDLDSAVLCVAYRSPNSSDCNNKLLLRSVVEL